MLLGTFHHSLDGKNRLVIPSKLAEELDGKLTVFPSLTDHCLCLYGEAEWQPYAAKINAQPRTKVHKLARYIFSNAIQLTPDSQNRIIIPSEMLEKVGIRKNVVTMSVSSYCEIWAEELYESEDVAAQPENMLELMEELDL